MSENLPDNHQAILDAIELIGNLLPEEVDVEADSVRYQAGLIILSRVVLKLMDCAWVEYEDFSTFVNGVAAKQEAQKLLRFFVHHHPEILKVHPKTSVELLDIFPPEVTQ